jgi:hypothetical protein
MISAVAAPPLLLLLLLLGPDPSEGQHQGCDGKLYRFVNNGSAMNESLTVGHVCHSTCSLSCPAPPPGTCVDDPDSSVAMLLTDCTSWLAGARSCGDAAKTYLGKAGNLQDYCPVACSCNNASTSGVTGTCNTCVAPLPSAPGCVDDSAGLLASLGTTCPRILGLPENRGLQNKWRTDWSISALVPDPANVYVPAVMHLNHHRWALDRCANDVISRSLQECGCTDPFAANYAPHHIYEDGSCLYTPHCAAGWTPRWAYPAGGQDRPSWAESNPPINEAVDASWSCSITAACESGNCTTAQYTSLAHTRIRGGGRWLFRHVKWVELHKTAAWDNGGAIDVRGGGYALDASKARLSISFAMFWNCSASSGGGISAVSGVEVAVSFTTFAFNRAEDAGAAIDVGANSEAHIACCTFFGNSAKMKGGAISGSSGPIFTVSFSTFFNNMAGEGEWLSALPRAARASRARR